MSHNPEWLTLSQAAALLGVHPSTVRRWADHGDLPVKLTPGGHRRFLRADLEARLRPAAVAPTPAPAVTGRVWGDYALVEARQRLFDRPEPEWLAAFDARQREEERVLGRRLMGLLMQHIAAPQADQALLVEARSIAVRYAQACQRAGLSATHGLEATAFFRDALTEVALQMPQVAHLDPEAPVRLLRKLNEIFNVVQVTVVDFFARTADPRES